MGVNFQNMRGGNGQLARIRGRTCEDMVDRMHHDTAAFLHSIRNLLICLLLLNFQLHWFVKSYAISY